MANGIRVAHVITTLDVGGAEIMLLRLLEARSAAMVPEVICLGRGGPLAERMRALGVPVRALGFSTRLPNPLLLPVLAAALHAHRPDVIQTWMHAADLIGGLAARLLGRPVVWGLHQGEFDLGIPGQKRARSIAGLCAAISSRVPARIVCCSRATLEAHVRIGYDRARSVCIPNGFDMTRFRPDPAARPSVRAELDIPDDAPLIGILARAHPEKDLPNFLRAAALFSPGRPSVHFILCGAGVTRENPSLQTREYELGSRLHLLGQREDVPRLLAACDLVTSSSAAEALPLAIGEAMACGVPCVVTDVGDSGWLIANTGRVVPRRDAAALARGWGELLDLAEPARRRLGAAARERIEAHFALPDTALRYEALYRSVAGDVTV